MAQTNKPNLLGASLPDLQTFLSSLGEQRFRATQIMKWIHQRGVADFDRMSNLSADLRQKLKTVADIRLPEIDQEHRAADGTVKWLIRLADGNSVETVYIPSETRATLCVSTQVGCSLNCPFCHTARQGFNRNLSSAEIIAQLWLASHRLQLPLKKKRAVNNVVIMGMGEPLANYEQTLRALLLMTEDNAYGLARSRVTVSTSGLIPAIKRLGRDVDVALAVSLHAPNDELRDKLVPVNRKYPLRELISACREYTRKHHKLKITFEYIMLDGVNDAISHAQQLSRLLAGVPSKINLIPFNSYHGSVYKCSKPRRMEEFQRILVRSGFNTIIRRTRGEDIGAACGQLAGTVNDRTGRSERFVGEPA